MGYSVGGLSFYLEGKKSSVKYSIEVMFELSWNPDIQGDIPFFVYDLKSHETDQLETILPKWLIPDIHSQVPSKDVYLYYGDGHGFPDDVASVAVDDFSIFCCYYCALARELNYILLRKEPQEVPLSVSSVIVPVLSELFAQQSKQLFHAASIYCPQQRVGMMIVADSGGGKTTTALSVLRKGAKMICDDLTVVSDQANGRFELSGLPELMNLTDETIDHFPELKKHRQAQIRNPYSDKYPISAQAVYGKDSMIKICGLDIIYFVSVTGKTPSVSPLGPSEAFGKLLKAKTFAKKQFPSKEKTAQLFSLLSSVQIYRLQTGDNPDVTGQWIIDNCKGHLSKNQ
ncbi:MAG: hypothetical protein ABIJ59_02980 [Pseudomonadota bacterium]